MQWFGECRPARALQNWEELIHIVFLRVSQINGCAHCMDLHARDMLKTISIDKAELFLTLADVAGGAVNGCWPLTRQGDDEAYTAEHLQEESPLRDRA